MNLIQRKLTLLAAPKLIRSGLMWLSAFFIAHHYQGGTDKVGLLFVGVLSLGISSLWSYWAKRPLGDDDADLVRNMATALASQLIPALSGVMVAHGMDEGVTAESSVSGVLLYVINHWLSATTRPDVKQPGAKLDLSKVPLFLLCSSLFALSSCSHIATSTGSINAIGSSGSYHDPKTGETTTWDSSAGLAAVADGAVSVINPSTTSGLIRAAGNVLARLWPKVFGQQVTAPTPVVVVTNSGK